MTKVQLKLLMLLKNKQKQANKKKQSEKIMNESFKRRLEINTKDKVLIAQHCAS